jgi:hypothetical protein
MGSETTPYGSVDPLAKANLGYPGSGPVGRSVRASRHRSARDQGTVRIGGT